MGMGRVDLIFLSFLCLPYSSPYVSEVDNSCFPRKLLWIQIVAFLFNNIVTFLEVDQHPDSITPQADTLPEINVQNFVTYFITCKFASCGKTQLQTLHKHFCLPEISAPNIQFPGIASKYRE